MDGNDGPAQGVLRAQGEPGGPQELRKLQREVGDIHLSRYRYVVS
jgi:hypothetical protein